MMTMIGLKILANKEYGKNNTNLITKLGFPVGR